MNALVKIVIMSILALGVAACGIKGDVKPPSSNTALTTSFTAR